MTDADKLHEEIAHKRALIEDHTRRLRVRQRQAAQLGRQDQIVGELKAELAGQRTGVAHVVRIGGIVAEQSQAAARQHPPGDEIDLFPQSQ